jgi:hypothetical protein
LANAIERFAYLNQRTGEIASRERKSITSGAMK